MSKDSNDLMRRLILYSLFVSVSAGALLAYIIIIQLFKC